VQNPNNPNMGYSHLLNNYFKIYHWLLFFTTDSNISTSAFGVNVAMEELITDDNVPKLSG
jgi:hypothetical protein